MVRERKIEVMHDELQNWKSYLLFIEDEMAFIQGLLDSYVFEPRTPSLFERLDTFKQNFETSKCQRRHSPWCRRSPPRTWKLASLDFYRFVLWLQAASTINPRLGGGRACTLMVLVQ